ncbi:MAG: PSD1 and planctomycete cytochrome C domain-containing protein [Pirellulaceae bacterium]|jgi:mono/diheme cytochrome c family protein|nr:PSD1 and planctomycete cytochrome C domain-containing protein [Pirellulaceae bacterium]
MRYEYFKLILIAGMFTSFHDAVAVSADEAVAANISAEDRDFFERQVRPLLVKRCFECHGGTKAGGGLSLQTALGWRKGGETGPAIAPGKPDESLLIDAINYRSLEMPPADKGGQLSAEEIAVLTKWVARGAPDPRDGSDVLGGMTREEAQKWWAFQPLPKLDPAEPVAEVKHIDALVDRELARRGLKPAPAADKRTLIRRLTYDLTGLPPTPEEVQAFLADEAPEALSQVIERLHHSPQYGVQWGRHWLDVVRYADTAGENTDRPLPHAWRYRNWVIDAFNRDMPFDQFVRLQLAGDLLANDRPGPQRAEGIIATGYLAIARRFGHDIDKDMHLTYEDVIDNLGKNFLGLTLGCARCHDHKYDPVSSRDYYALSGIFESTRFAFPGCEPKGQPRDLVPLIPQAEVDSLMQPWQAKTAEVEAEKRRRQVSAESAAKKIQSTWTEAKRTLIAGKVPEGASVPFEQRLQVRRGEVVLLSVSPNASHGADSTLLEWSIRETGGQQRSWSVADLVADLMQGNSCPAAHEASWSFLEITTTPVFLTERHDSINGNRALKSWSLGSEPSVFVNSADQPVTVWTTLPAKSFFVHPGPNRPVAVAWTSPLEGPLMLTGRVADAHPAGLDGVAFQVDHVAAPDIGSALADVGKSAVGLPDAGPPPVIPVAYAVADREVKNARFHERGDPEKLGEEVPRRWLAVFGGAEVPHDSGSGRRELADWVAGHPLMARVLVNRIWEWHFGRGLVRSSNDFGTRGEPPTHPELLDLLAAKFVQSGYSVKAMHRLILHTAAYQRASATPAADDPENRWLAHFNRRRLTAEELRDGLLAVSGRLDLSPGEAHPFPAETTWTFTQHAPFNADYETNRRSAFLMVQRQRRHPFLALFDGADPNASTPTRQTTTVPTQALYFINDPFFHEQASQFAEILLAAPHDEARLLLASQALFQREPSQAERERTQRFLGSYPGELAEKWSALARVLLASNEFLYVE